MANAVFWNEIQVGPGNKDFIINAGSASIAQGTYASFLEFRNAFMTAAQTVVATLRSGISSTGHFTIDNNGGANFTVTFSDIEIGYLLGFTGSLSAAANTFTAPRRIGASLYLEHGGGRHAATIKEHDPMPGLVHVTQTEALSGVRRTTRSGVRRKRARFEIQFLDNSARFVSPSGAVTTTYANAGTAVYDIGLTQFEHAKFRWWDPSNIAAQGWGDGRRIRFIEDSTNATFAQSAAAWAWASPAPYTDWVADADSCKEFGAEKARPPSTAAYHMTVPVSEYFTP